MFCTGKETKASDSHVIRFELSSIGALRSYWGLLRPDSATGNGQQREQESHCNRAKMILLDAAETHLKDYVKSRHGKIVSGDH